ncbi:MAG: peptidylprolyl isomerase [Proteobacteria bacterium]|nr:peptidylprolyl isomerase [Pseudomonadota bacterium]
MAQRAESSDSGNTNTALSSKETEPEPLPPEHDVTDRVKINTSIGSVVVGLYGKDAPGTVKNFLKYVDNGFYKDKIFHRVIPGFMIQSGGFDSDMNKAKAENHIRLEIIPGLKHELGVISMARTSELHSASSQFFICVGNAPQLNGSYATFGRVEEGMDIVLLISKVSTRTVDVSGSSMADVPSQSIIIESIDRL